MYSQMDPMAFEHSAERARERLRLVFHKAVSLGAHVTLDMEQTPFKDLTLALYTGLLEEPELRGYPHTGVILQSYLPGTPGDLDSLICWARERGQRLTVRLVKGTYWGLGFFRTYFQFDVSSLSGQTVDSALLRIWQYSAGPAAGGLPCDAHRVTGAWDESSITWNTKPPHWQNESKWYSWKISPIP